MELWQVTYVIGVFAGLVIGGVIDPYLAVVFIWAFVLAAEALHYRAESRRFEKKMEEREKEVTP
ncbi:MAG: hypothetical protein U9M97_05555 [Candidatus Hadarchaeota archaeon]|nr:hypothetical protein [Candidatus Hadarchaeota archaeon]